MFRWNIPGTYEFLSFLSPLVVSGCLLHRTRHIAWWLFTWWRHWRHQKPQASFADRRVWNRIFWRSAWAVHPWKSHDTTLDHRKGGYAPFQVPLLYVCNLKLVISKHISRIERFLWNCPQLNAKISQWWSGSIGSGNKPLLNKSWPCSMTPNGVISPQWGNICLSQSPCTALTAGICLSLRLCKGIVTGVWKTVGIPTGHVSP